MTRLRRLSVAATLIGVAAMAVLMQRQGIDQLMQLFTRAGWPLLALLPLRLLPLMLDAIGWRLLLAREDRAGRAGLAYLLWVTSVRESVSRLLPLSTVGGELIGVRLVLLRGLPGALAAGSIVIQLLISLVNQYLFALLGLALILHLHGALPLLTRIAWALAVLAPLPVAAALSLRHGRLFERVHGLLRRLLGGSIEAFGLDGAALDRAIGGYLQQPLRLAASALWEFAALVLGALENCLALGLLGQPVDLATALALEAVTQAVRRLFVMVPASLGVQEAGLMLLGPLLGVGPDMALALSLAKRLRELLLGVPALLSWQWLEWRRLRAGH